MKKILLLLILNLALSGSVPALAATKLPPGRVPESRPLQPAPGNEFPEYLESITPSPSEIGSDEDGNTPADQDQSNTPANDDETLSQNGPASNTKTPLGRSGIFWVVVVILLIAGGAFASLRLEKRNDQ